MISSGRLRHRVRIDERRNLLDSNGDTVQDENTGEVAWEWSEVATVWAAVEPLSAREFIAAKSTQSQVVARITMRHRKGLDASMRLVHVRAGRPDVVYNMAGLLADRDSGLEFFTVPVSAGVNEG